MDARLGPAPDAGGTAASGVTASAGDEATGSICPRPRRAAAAAAARAARALLAVLLLGAAPAGPIPAMARRPAPAPSVRSAAGQAASGPLPPYVPAVRSSSLEPGSVSDPVPLPVPADTPVAEALVLGGGGSRGLAHAGVLVGLERLGRPPGLVVGTSMGAIIGALYAAGYDAAQVRDIVERSEWRSAFGYPPIAAAAGPPPVRPLLRFGFGGAGMRPQGLSADEGVNRLLVHYLFDAGVRARGNFDRLPRRFRAVAADLATGRAVVLGSGDLPRAVRASMAVPAVFPPVVMDGRVLVDGGLADNLAVDVARALGARMVIASDVVLPDSDVSARDPLRLGLRGLRLLIHNAAPDTPPDVLIRPHIPLLFPSSFFPRDPEFLVRAGLEATLAALAPLPPAGSAGAARTGSAAGARERATRAGGPAHPGAAPPASIAAVRVEGVDPSTAALVAGAFRGAAPAPYDAAAILADVDLLYATGMLDAVWPRVAGGDTLVVRAEPRPPLDLSLAGGYAVDRGARGWVVVRGRVGRGELSLLGSADGLRRELVAGWRIHAVERVAAAPGLGGYLRATQVRSFEGADVAGRDEVRRLGGWAGLDVTLPHPALLLSAQLRGERVSAGAGPKGRAAGGVLRLEDLRERPLAGVPLDLSVEAWGGALTYRVARGQAAARGSLGRWHGALVVQAAGISGAAPLDAYPALGDARALPGLRWGEDRARSVIVLGGDVAYPIPLAGSIRLRLRSGRAAGAIPGGTAPAAWRGGAELAGVWDTPVGRLETGFGASPGRRRFFLDLGAPF